MGSPSLEAMLEAAIHLASLETRGLTKHADGAVIATSQKSLMCFDSGPVCSQGRFFTPQIRGSLLADPEQKHRIARKTSSQAVSVIALILLVVCPL